MRVNCAARCFAAPAAFKKPRLFRFAPSRETSRAPRRPAWRRRLSRSLTMEVNELSQTLVKEDLVIGKGEAAESGSDVLVHYVGWLENGQQFDSSRARRDPLDFALGAGDVIKGWDQGIAGMKVGGKRKLVVPPSLAYGEHGCGGVIPPHATLVFEVELLEVR